MRKTSGKTRSLQSNFVLSPSLCNYGQKWLYTWPLNNTLLFQIPLPLSKSFLRLLSVGDNSIKLSLSPENSVLDVSGVVFSDGGSPLSGPHVWTIGHCVLVRGKVLSTATESKMPDTCSQIHRINSANQILPQSTECLPCEGKKKKKPDNWELFLIGWLLGLVENGGYQGFMSGIQCQAKNAATSCTGSFSSSSNFPVFPIPIHSPIQILYPFLSCQLPGRFPTLF